MEAVGEGSGRIRRAHVVRRPAHLGDVLRADGARRSARDVAWYGEIFGPVVCVYGYDDIDDAIARANSLPFAFQASVCTRSLDVAMRAFRRIDASAVLVNESPTFRVDWMPFAGLRESGLGVGGVPYEIRDMQIEKMLVIKSAELP